MRVGLFFGSFDPFHNGHLAIAGYALAHGGLDALWLVLSPQNPHKLAHPPAPYEERADFITRVIARVGEPRLSLCQVERDLPLPSYTIRTLTALQGQHPAEEFCLIMGSDSLASLPGWREGPRILREYRILVYPRAQGAMPTAELLEHGNIRQLEAPLLQISSSFVREARARGENVAFYLPV